jgi:post-segregation antitoxin (ccd killing protein)
MTTLTIGDDGCESVHTTVAVPRHLRDLAKDRGISLSKTLQTALENEVK